MLSSSQWCPGRESKQFYNTLKINTNLLFLIKGHSKSLVTIRFCIQCSVLIAPLQRGAILLHVHVLYSVMHLGLFGIVESVQGANKITGNTSNSLELNALANDAVFICMKSCVHNDISIYSCK